MSASQCHEFHLKLVKIVDILEDWVLHCLSFDALLESGSRGASCWNQINGGLR